MYNLTLAGDESLRLFYALSGQRGRAGKETGQVDYKLNDFIRLKKQVLLLGNQLFRLSLKTFFRFGKPHRGFAKLFHGFGEMGEQNGKPVS